MQDFNLWIIQQFVNGDSTKLDPQIANIMWIKNNAVFFFAFENSFLVSYRSTNCFSSEFESCIKA